MLENRYKHPHEDRPQTVLHEILTRGQFSPETRKKYRIVLDQWITFAGTDPSHWTRATFARWRDSLIARELAQETIETYLAALKYVAKWWGSTYGQPDFTIIQPINLPTAPPKQRRPPSYEETARLLETCIAGKPDLYDHRDLVLMIVGFDTGMRRESLASMSWDKIGLLSVGAHGPYPSADVPIKGKGGLQRMKVPLSDLALEALESWQTALGVKHGYVFRRLIRTKRKNGDTVVKVTPARLSGTSIYKIFDKRGEQAGVKMYPHLVRHAFVTWRALENVDLFLITSVTGHAMGRGASFLQTAIDPGEAGRVKKYLNLERAGEDGRKTTPQWFAKLARRVLKEFT